MRLLTGCLLLLAVAGGVRAQGTSGPTVGSSGVGYIDNAIPGWQFRLRYDAAWNFRRPNRAEFFWAQGAPNGPGVPFPERSVDYQDVTAYAEVPWTCRFSTFVDVPTRFLNPEVNADAAGLSDINAGFKYAFIRTDEWIVTGQLRTWTPTGDAGRGLGTRHVSLEPALLTYWAPIERLAFESELRYWVPIGGTDFAGDVIRYGTGVQYTVWECGGIRVIPVAELVGWVVLGGQQSVVFPSGLAATEGASGDSILTGLLGVRVGCGENASVYASYGRPVTGDRWYENGFRLELRLTY